MLVSREGGRSKEISFASNEDPGSTAEALPRFPPPPFSGEKAPFHTPFRVTMLWLVKESWWIARLHLLGMITEGTGFDQ